MVSAVGVYPLPAFQHGQGGRAEHVGEVVEHCVGVLFGHECGGDVAVVVGVSHE